MRFARALIMTLLRILLPALLLAATLAAQTAADFLRAGKVLVEQGEIDKALFSFDYFKQRFPDDARPYIYSGIALVRAGRIHDAGIELNQALTRNPGVEDALELARVLDELDYLDLAVQVLAEHQDSPRLQMAGLWLLSDIHFRRHQPDQALEALEKFAERNPYDPRIPQRRGEIHLLAGRLEEALVEFEKIAGRKPDDQPALLGMAQTLFRGNNFKAARETAAKLVKLDPESPEYLHLLGNACRRQGEPAEAVRHLEAAASLPGAATQVLFDLGAAYRESGDQDNARRVLTRYQERFSEQEVRSNREQQVIQLTNQAMQQVESGQIREAVASFRRVLELDPDHWETHVFLSKIYLSSTQGQLAVPHLTKLLELDPQSSEARYMLATLHFERGETQKALDLADEARRLRPGHADLRNLLGNIYFSLDQKDKALLEYEAAMKLMPERPGFRMNYETVKNQLEQE